MSMAIHDGADGKAVDGFGQPRLTEEGKDFKRLTRDRVRNRGVMQHHDSALSANLPPSMALPKPPAKPLNP
jgi:hypothetical protein